MAIKSDDGTFALYRVAAIGATTRLAQYRTLVARWPPALRVLVARVPHHAARAVVLVANRSAAVLGMVAFARMVTLRTESSCRSTAEKVA